MKRFKTLVIWVMLLVMILSLAVTGCGSREQPDRIVVGSKPFTEGYLGSELIAVMLEAHTDLLVERKFGIAGGTSNLHEGMLTGDFDIYPEYTGTSWLFVLKEDSILSNGMTDMTGWLIDTVFNSGALKKWISA